jgi:hypothetical protein
LDNRLKKISEIVLSRSQKGFTSKRQIQECIININETVAYAEQNKIPGFVLALDMAKAFDTVRHDFVNEVYKFFGLGPWLINALNTISTGRTASIILGGGRTTAPFVLGSGFPQGNPPSPNQFNLVQQIFLFKMELDPRIERLKIVTLGPQLPVRDLAPAPVPVPVPVPDGDGLVVVPDPVPVPAAAVAPIPVPVRSQYGQKENNGETGNVESFADDATVMAKLTLLAVQTVTEILNSFGWLSGLKCNVDKSQIMIVGTNTVPEYVDQFGFVVATNLKILGFDITKNAADLEQIISKATDKIKNIIRFWNRFRLSLVGRINVAKTLLISQLNYFVSIIPVPEAILQEISHVINNFIKGSLKINREAIALDVDKGGLGFFDLKNFISSLQCSWAKKASNSTIDNWRVEIQKKTQGIIEILEPRMFNKKINPILYSIAKSFMDFKFEFYLQNDNFLQSNILGNPHFMPSVTGLAGVQVPDPDPESPDPEPIDIWNFWATDGMVNIVHLSRLKIFDLLDDTLNVKQDPVLSQMLNIPIERVAILKRSLQTALRYVKKNKFQIRTTTNSLQTFIMRFKKGSRNFRKVLDYRANAKVKCSRSNKIKTFFRLTEIPTPPESELHKLNSEWSTCVFPVKLREFSFKFRNNALGLNTRVSHFNRNVNRGCTFCTINNLGNWITNNNIQLQVRRDVGGGGWRWRCRYRCSPRRCRYRCRCRCLYRCRYRYRRRPPRCQYRYRYRQQSQMKLLFICFLSVHTLSVR